MTITTTRTIEKYIGDGSQNAWPITFPFFEGSDIKACIVNSTGEQVDLTYGTDYTVSVSSGSTSGTLYYTLAGGVILTIWLSLPITQGTDFYNTGPLNAEVLETSLDRLTLIAQQLQEASDRSVKVATSSNKTPEELLAELYTGRDAAVTSASAAATSESNAAASERNAASSAITAQAWAESETSPDPNDAESKSAKSWALVAGDAVPIASTTYAGKVMASASLTVDQTTGEATIPAATEIIAGILKIPTETLALAGIDDSTAMTPLRTKNVLDVCRASDDDMAEGTSTTKFPSVAQVVDFVDGKADANVVAIYSNSDGTTRYRKWSDGLIEQWFKITVSSSIITFPTPFTDSSSINIQITFAGTSSASDVFAGAYMQAYNVTTTGFTTYVSSVSTYNTRWYYAS